MKKSTVTQIGAPLLTPNDLHFTLDALSKIIVARRTAKDNMAYTQPFNCMAFPT